MGPLRRGLILALLPTPALAEVCDKERPFWTPGAPATAFDEMIALFSSPAALVLLALSVAVVLRRSQWGALALVVLWTMLSSVVAFNLIPDPTGIRELAIAEGCIGPPTLFLTAVTAICVAMILYTNPRPARGD